MYQFEHSTSTLIIHEKSNGQSALEKLEEKVKEKRNSRRNDYVVISDTEDVSDAENDKILNESEEESYDQEPSIKPTPSNSINVSVSNNVNNYIQEIEKRHQETVNELKIKIDTLSTKLEQTENDKNEMIKTLKDKDYEISKLQKEIKQLKETQLLILSDGETTDDERKQNYFVNDNKNKNKNNDKKKNTLKPEPIKVPSGINNNKRPKSPKSPKSALNYDRTKEQIKILNTLIFKSKSLSLLMEQEKISKSGGKGLILFFSKYLPNKTVDQIFSRTAQSSKTAQESDPNYITNASGLVNLLSFVTILYKVKVHQVKTGSSKRPKIDNSDIKNAVKYLAIWIVRTYGEKTQNTYFDNKTNKRYANYDFKLSKDDFAVTMSKYLQDFIDKQGNHIDSQL